ncbi:DUF3825 domain-containing protein [Slackia sp.]|uniref:DUF3825 domain-containing protein n=1 Tax=Slackia sp. TaxID=2049041 RepID=UPI0026141795|nr:DUF3825 domain-containing protein [Slackia sp.]
MTARKKDEPRMSAEDRLSIYGILKKNFSFDEDYPLANLGWCFVREGINKEDYGFLKLKAMLEEMVDFVSTSTKEIGGVSQSMFTLHEFAPFEEKLAEEEESEDAQEGASGSDEKPEASEISSDAKKENKQSVSEMIVDEEKCKKETNTKNNTGKKIDTRNKKEISTESNSSNAKDDKEEKDSKKTSATRDVNDFKDKNETRDEKALNNKNESSNKKVAKEQKDTKECRKAEGDDGAGVKGDRRSSVAALPSPAQGEIAPSRRLESPKGSSSKQKAKPSLKPASRFQAVSRASGDRPRRRVIPGKALERFGYLGTWPDFLRTLANLALDEPWDFCNQDIGEATRKYDILHNYIRYTFYRLTLEDKIGFSSDEDFAVFNTGLVDRHYEDIYACFEPSDPERPEEARYAWSFAGFCTAGTGRLGKRLVRELNPLPQPASYLERKEDLLFDLDREVVCDVHHIVVDNVHRLPVNFLRDELASSQECLGILAGIEDLTDGARGDRFEKLRIVIENDTRLFNRLSTSINAAIDVAKRQVRWNYKTAVPAYYPRTNSMNLLLPLILTDSPTPDVALVVELQKSGNYQGQTVVTMAQAYRDARLLCRPYIDWLSPASIIDAAEEEDEEE